MIKGMKIKLGEYKYDKKTGKVKMRKPFNIFSEQDKQKMIVKLNEKQKGVENVSK